MQAHPVSSTRVVCVGDISFNLIVPRGRVLNDCLGLLIVPCLCVINVECVEEKDAYHQNDVGAKTTGPLGDPCSP